jgi:5,10-methylenetetrahydrofolate reductase
MEMSVTAAAISQILHSHHSSIEQISKEMMTHVPGIMTLARFSILGKIAIMTPEANVPLACQRQLKSESETVEEG